MSLPVPKQLSLVAGKANNEEWQTFKRAWEMYELAAELEKKSEKVQIATFLTIIGEEGRKRYETIKGQEEDLKLKDVIEKFD